MISVCKAAKCKSQDKHDILMILTATILGWDIDY